MHITEEFLREAIQMVRSVKAFDTGHFTDSDIMKMHDGTIGAIIQAKTALYIHDGQQARRP